MNSQTTSRELCTYHRHSCSRPRYQSYKYCAHHVLEDDSSPFTSCEYTSRSSGRKCPNPALRSRKSSNLPSFCEEHLRDLIAKEQHQKQKKKLKKKRKTGKVGNSNAIDVKRQKLIDQIAAAGQGSTKAQDSSDSEVEIVHRPITDDWKLENSEDMANNADWDDFDPVNNEVYEPLRYADVLTPEEVVATAQSKLIRLQSLYIEQFKRLFHLLKERKRQYLHDLKKEIREERATGTASAVEPENFEGMNEDEIYALATYRKRSGTEVLLRRKQLKRRVESSVTTVADFSLKSSPQSRCSHASNHTRCKSTCLPYTKYCSAHILDDPHQLLYKKCQVELCPTPVCSLLSRQYELKTDEEESKSEQVFYCSIHAPLPEMNFSFILNKDKDQDMDVDITTLPEATDKVVGNVSEPPGEDPTSMDVDDIVPDSSSLTVPDTVREVTDLASNENGIKSSVGVETLTKVTDRSESNMDTELDNVPSTIQPSTISVEDTSESKPLEEGISLIEQEKTDRGNDLQNSDIVCLSPQPDKTVDQSTNLDAAKAEIPTIDLTQTTPEKKDPISADENDKASNQAATNEIGDPSNKNEIASNATHELNLSGETKSNLTDEAENNPNKPSESPRSITSGQPQLLPHDKTALPAMPSNNENDNTNPQNNDNQEPISSENQVSHVAASPPKISEPDSEPLMEDLTKKIPLEQIAEVVQSLPVVLKPKMKPFPIAVEAQPSSCLPQKDLAPLTTDEHKTMDEQNVVHDRESDVPVAEVNQDPIVLSEPSPSVSVQSDTKQSEDKCEESIEMKGVMTSCDMNINIPVPETTDIEGSMLEKNESSSEFSPKISEPSMPNINNNSSNEDSKSQSTQDNKPIQSGADPPAPPPPQLLSPPVLSSFMGHRGERKPSSADEEVAVVSLLSLCTGHPSDDNTQSSSNEQE